jgi:radical SAM superfamily enzyme YgiQ (UPF0313 family)
MRFLLINPPSPVQLGSPLLGQQYVAAALRAAGVDVRIIDASARRVRPTANEILHIVDDWQPDIIGMALFSRWVYHAYALARDLRGKARWLVAGGAHVTACPLEPLDYGFDAVLTGEAEQSVVDFVEFAAGRKAPEGIPGLILRNPQGKAHPGASAGFVQDLDALSWPMLAQDLYKSEWYHASDATAIPGGMLTSRGCPARCTFCANYVTGRKFRHRSTTSVLEEMEAMHRIYGLSFFPFWDDAFTANRQRLFEMMRAFETELSFVPSWFAITRATHAQPEILRAMKRAGCSAINFGVESGDDEILRAIKKGVTTAQVVQALENAKAEGFVTACNFMLGFPQETPREIEHTLRFMEQIAHLVDSFSTLGVVVPFPGTPLYDDFHVKYGFTNWWLREEYSHCPEASADDAYYYRRQYIDDANLELDFFRYSEEHRALIRECLRFKGEHNLRRMGIHPEAAIVAEPVAG